ncbi:tetratricopeptide repeat protein [Flavobacterium ardleyense]|uniref:tetratricopeptide repeat protein n=1 Tax=Flavobacterium ardleyense TaxID=2038737 RepID=UPI00298D57D5|nr:tetratricopeptide repeat protein [Flavobacterium ardleyense]
MKKVVILAGALLISGVTFAQKNELKSLKKILDKTEAPDAKQLSEYKSNATAAKGFLGSADASDKVYINFYNDITPLLEYNSAVEIAKGENSNAIAKRFFSQAKLEAMVSSMNAVTEFEKTSGKAVHSKDIEKLKPMLSTAILNYAIALGNDKKYSEAAKALYSSYQLDKKDQDNLYYASTYAITANDYDLALKYYNELKDLKYSGEKTNFLARNIATEKEESFATKDMRNKMITFKTHDQPRDQKEPSKRGEIYKNVALILVQQGKIEEAKKAIADAKIENPNDESLMLTEADLYLQLKDYDGYKKVVNQLLEKNPNDADLVYNLGVIAFDADNLTEAEQYFRKAVSINPEYANAYVNIAAIKFKEDKLVVEKMNKLGTSAADNKKYEAFKAERAATFKGLLPLLEKAYAIEPENQNVIYNLMTVYNYLEMTAKYKELKAKVKE